MNSTHSHIAAIILAAGRGERSGQAVPKQFVDIAGEPVLRRTIRAFQQFSPISHIQVVIHPDDAQLYEAAIGNLSPLPPAVAGALTRQGSVLSGLEAIVQANPDTVLIHDGARPFVTSDLLQRVIDAVEPDTGVVPALPVSDTLRSSGGEYLGGTVPRDGLYAMQTPQAFPFRAILDAHQKAAQQGQGNLTDDAAVFQLAAMKIRHVPGDRDNIKLTRADDFTYAERMLSAENEIRIGQGYDVHAFEDGDGVHLCGVRIPFDRSLKGHSDADVGLHALTDAIFGALADGDIGHHFPPSDPRWKDASSNIFLEEAIASLVRRRGRLINIDLTLVCEEPKVGPHRDAMRQSISTICDISPDRVSVKATTTERLGFTGRGEGIAAIAVATVSVPVGP